jgi:hypothetical protein
MRIRSSIAANTSATPEALANATTNTIQTDPVEILIRLFCRTNKRSANEHPDKCDQSSFHSMPD